MASCYDNGMFHLGFKLLLNPNRASQNLATFYLREEKKVFKILEHLPYMHVSTLNPLYLTVKPVLSNHSNKDQNWFSRPIIAQCRSKVVQNAFLGHSAILLTFIQLPFVFKTFVLSIFEWPLHTGFTVFFNCKFHIKVPAAMIIECFTLVLNCSLTLIEPLKIWRVGMGLNMFEDSFLTCISNWRYLAVQLNQEDIHPGGYISLRNIRDQWDSDIPYPYSLGRHLTH